MNTVIDIALPIVTIMEESLIGRLYTPIDNSYEVNFTHPERPKLMLAGTWNTKGVISTITSEPFELPIISPISGKEKVFKFIACIYDNQTFVTMFHEKGLLEIQS